MDIGQAMTEGSQKGKRTRICKECGKEGTMTCIMNHIEVRHITGVSHPCGQCGKMYATRNALHNHKTRSHSTQNWCKVYSSMLPNTFLLDSVYLIQIYIIYSNIFLVDSIKRQTNTLNFQVSSMVAAVSIEQIFPNYDKKSIGDVPPINFVHSLGWNKLTRIHFRSFYCLDILSLLYSCVLNFLKFLVASAKALFLSLQGLNLLPEKHAHC